MKTNRAALLISLALLAIPFAASAKGPCLSQTIGRGSKGSEVLALQQYLVAQKLLAADGATGYFGAMSETAVQTWQRIYGPVSAGTPATTGYGMVGAKTRGLICADTDAPALTTSTATAMPTAVVTPPAPIVATPVSPVGVGEPPAFQSFRATPEIIDAVGESVRLSWAVFRSGTCSVIADGTTKVVSNVGPIGDHVVSPDKPTSYSLGCWGLGDSSTSTPVRATTTSLTVGVRHMPPTCEITLDKSTYKLGDDIRLSWVSTGAEYGTWSHARSDTITMPYGQIESSGRYFYQGNLIFSQTVELTVTGRGGTGTCSARISVRAASAGFFSQLASLGAGLLYPPVRR